MQRSLKAFSQYPPRPPHPFLLGGDNFQSQILKKRGQEKKYECLGYLPGGLTMFLVKKDLKIKHGFEGSISNVDLGLF